MLHPSGSATRVTARRLGTTSARTRDREADDEGSRGDGRGCGNGGGGDGGGGRGARRGRTSKRVERPEPQAAINDVVVEIHASGFVPTEMAWPSTWTDRLDRDRTPVIPGH